MADGTGIEWTDATWNPITGCSRVSEGCRNCYAERFAHRFSGAGQHYEGLTVLRNGHPAWTGKIQFNEKSLLLPLKWKAPRRVFVNSMSDLFHENVSDAQRDRIFAVMALCPQHTFQVLTKRPERMNQYLQSPEAGVEKQIAKISPDLALDLRLGSACVLFPLFNVWLGVSVENQEMADKRIPLLLRTPAARRFLSCEPLLGPLSLRWKNSTDFGTPHPRHKHPEPDARGRVSTDEYDGLRELDWVIGGGESGPGARRMLPEWARTLRDECVAAKVPFFFKQWGEWDADGLRVGKKESGAMLDAWEWKEFPR